MTLAAILPPAVAVVEGPIAWAVSAGGLAPGEESAVAGAVPRRRREYTAGRVCAHRALARLGRPTGAIAAGPRREPIWPPGVVGSITHTDHYVAAAVARQADLAAVGVDVEDSVPHDLAELVCAPGEWLWCAAAPQRRLPLLFSAKESVFKAVYPLTRRELGFRDVCITVGAGRFSAAGPPPLYAVEGAYRERGGTVFTAAWLRA